MYKFISTLLYALTRMLNLLKVKGKENLPTHTRFVVTCSHKGWVDVIMLALALYPIPVHFMAKKELFDSKITGKFLRSIHAFPVNRENPGPSTLKIPLKLLKEEKCVGIFPGGTRTTEEIPLKRGAVTIALKANALLVPAAYNGPITFKDLLRGKKSTIMIGSPIELKNDGRNRDEVIDEYVKRLDSEIKLLENR
ncbi:lysophospholipid acyltransferase family protein [Metabacillus endolithicus]|uniref:Lysophospholipid acyltransferase family protein n=1 Tax=Metabacillus endolithicus TaxID=1535204 RepID=A0ABW5BS94_9BACI|nr:1-acyl-sn-glycerol-3-phosphate acyltransferase [Metabacillus endolithicus]UPG63682.1 1-acyl-sn-glycerol-3-phosphate acyltransferase [Metabacillus endolithicus]